MAAPGACQNPVRQLGSREFRYLRHFLRVARVADRAVERGPDSFSIVFLHGEARWASGLELGWIRGSWVVVLDLRAFLDWHSAEVVELPAVGAQKVNEGLVGLDR